MHVVESKIKKFFSNQHRGRVLKVKPRISKKVTSIKFDRISKMHMFTKNCLVSSYKAAGRLRPRIVHSSLPKVMSRFYTKRAVLRKVKSKVVGSK